jgi:Haemolysin-type calcium binding protein related domain
LPNGGIANGAHGDTFIYNASYGEVVLYEIDPSPNANNILQFGAGITVANVSVTVDALGNIELTDGREGDLITLDNEAYGSSYGVQTVQFADGTTWN